MPPFRLIVFILYRKWLRINSDFTTGRREKSSICYQQSLPLASTYRQPYYFTNFWQFQCQINKLLLLLQADTPRNNHAIKATAAFYSIKILVIVSLPCILKYILKLLPCLLHCAFIFLMFNTLLQCKHIFL